MPKAAARRLAAVVTTCPVVRRESGRRGSNPRHQAWKACALPTELLPRTSSPAPAGALLLHTWWGKDSNLRRREPADLQSAPVGHLGTPPDTLLVPTKATDRR